MASKLSEATVKWHTDQLRAILEILTNHIEAGGAYPEGDRQSIREAHKVYQAAKPPDKKAAEED